MFNQNPWREEHPGTYAVGWEKPKGPKNPGKASGKGDKPKGVCFDKFRTGHCARDNCRYAHDHASLTAAKEEKGAKGGAVAVVDPDTDFVAKAGQKGLGKKEKRVRKKGKGKLHGQARVPKTRATSTFCANI